jgi:hypothetical protein
LKATQYKGSLWLSINLQRRQIRAWREQITTRFNNVFLSAATLTILFLANSWRHAPSPGQALVCRFSDKQINYLTLQLVPCLFIEPAKVLERMG